MAMVSGKSDGGRLYLFFSASCSHCEKVIEEIGSDNICTVHFNPVEKIEKFAVREATLFNDYEPKVNRALLQSLSINEVPILMAKAEEEILVLKGEKRIREYLQRTCRQSRNLDFGGTSQSMPSGYNFIPKVQKPEEGACSLDTDCDPRVAPSAIGQ
jgi:hypothetical protein